MKSKALAVLIATALIASAPAQLRPKHHFILSSDHLTLAIVKALSQQGIETDAKHVSLLGNVVTTDPSPYFDVQSIQPQRNTTHSTIKLTCRQPATCLPFFALVDEPEITKKLQPSLSGTPATKSQVVMRTGTPATLLMDDSRERLQISVVSMESGNAGRTIRVRTPDHKRIYSAEILNANTLEARF